MLMEKFSLALGLRGWYCVGHVENEDIFSGIYGISVLWLTPQGDYIGFCHSEHEDSWSLPGIQATLRRVF